LMVWYHQVQYGQSIQSSNGLKQIDQQIIIKQTKTWARKQKNTEKKLQQETND
jgi:hypothetical protein